MLHVMRVIFLSIVVVASLSASVVAEDWPQWRGKNRDGVWTETGVVEKFAGEQLPIKWRAEIGAGYSREPASPLTAAKPTPSARPDT
jgi:hypothetical protein